MNITDLPDVSPFGSLSFSLSFPRSLAVSSTMTTAVDFLAQEKIWFDKPRFDEAERHFYERANGASHSAQVPRPTASPRAFIPFPDTHALL